MSSVIRATIYIPDKLYSDARDFFDKHGTTVGKAIRDHIVKTVFTDCDTMVDLDKPCRCRHHLFGEDK